MTLVLFNDTNITFVNELCGNSRVVSLTSHTEWCEERGIDRGHMSPTAQEECR